MTVADAPSLALIDGLEREIEAAREDLVARVSRLDALRDLHLRATDYRDRTGRDPSIEDLMAAGEVEAAALKSLARRITQGDDQ